MRGGRRLKLGALFAMLLCLCLGTGMYLFVALHFGHVWSLLIITGLLFMAFIIPATCFGYDNEDPYLLMSNATVSAETFMHCRDLGYVAAIVFFLLTYVIPTVAWYSSRGHSPDLYGAIVIFLANGVMACAYVLWYAIFVVHQ